jgi:hypothetical protein
MTVAAELADLYLRHAYGLEDADASRSWIRRAVMKASSTPTTDLGRVPASIEVERTEASPEAMCGTLSHLACVAGSMAVDLIVDHPVVEARNRSAAYDQMDDALGSADRRHYTSGYKSTAIDLSEVSSDAVDHASATMTLQPSTRREAASGLSADYEPFASMMYALTAAAQMSQVVLYGYDQLSRETSNNMWLRRLSMEMPRPVRIERPFLIQTALTKTSVLPMKASRWRSASFSTSFPGIQMEYNLAHELTAKSPDSPEKSQ